MARHKKNQAAEDDEPKLDISSLIDATFLLLCYFLVTTTIQPREQDLNMALPAANQEGPQMDIEPKLIRVDENGAIYVGAGDAQLQMDTDVENHDVPMLAENLNSYANMAKAVNNKPVIQIYVDGGAKQQRVIDVLNAVAGAGIETVTFTDLVDP